MALVLKDRVKETTTTTGTGTLTLAGASAGFQSFAAIGNGNTTYYAIVDSNSGAWEVGTGTYTSSGTTLSRTTVLSSSNSGTLVNFGAGSKDVFCTYPSEQGVWLDASGNVVQNTFASLTVTGAATLGSGTINAVPTVGTDIANKSYVDTTATGLHVHTAVYVSTTGTGAGTTYADGGTTPTWTTITSTSEIATGSAHGLSIGAVIVFGSTTNGLTAGYGYFVKSTPTTTSITLSLIKDGPTITTLTNGTGLSITSRANSGVGATITNNTNGTLTTIDGVAVTVGNRVLVWTWTNAYANGVYTITSVGSGATPWVLTRSSDTNIYDPRSDSALGEGDYFFIQNGNTYKGDSVVLGTQGTIIFGTTNLSFNIFANSVVYSAGTGLTLTSDVFSITDTGVSATTYGSGSNVPTIAVNAQGQITSASNTAIAISATQITGGTIDTARISGSYTGITGVGTIATGVWNGTSVTTAYGGTGVSTYTAGDLVYYASGTALSKLAIGTTNYVLTSSGTAPQYVAQSTLTVGAATKATNVAGGAANQLVYNSGADTTTFAAAPSSGSTYLYWTGSAFAWGSVVSAYPATGIPNSTGSAWGTSYTTSGSGTVVALATSPSFTTPTLGVASATTINKVALTTPATGSTLTILDGKTLTVNNSLTLTGTDSTSMTFPSSSATVAGLGISQTFTGTQTLAGTSSVLAEVLTNVAEPVTVSATAATGTIAFYPSTQSVLYYTSNASGNFVVNFTFSSGTTLNTAMSTGQSLTAAFLVTNGSTAYYNSSIQVDGTTSGVSTKWQGGTAPSSGNASSIDVYTYTIIKTGSAAFTVLASQTKFA